MAHAKIPVSVLKSLLRERDVISMHFGADVRGTYCLFKFRLRNGTDDVVIAPTMVAFHVRNSLARAIKRLMYRDTRRRKDDPRPELTEVRTFLDSQPDIEQSDWDGKDRSRVAVGCEVRTFRDAVFLGFNVGDGATYKVLRFSPQLSFYLVDTLARMERDGALKDMLGLASGQKH